MNNCTGRDAEGRASGAFSSGLSGLSTLEHYPPGPQCISQRLFLRPLHILARGQRLGNRARRALRHGLERLGSLSPVGKAVGGRDCGNSLRVTTTTQKYPSGGQSRNYIHAHLLQTLHTNVHTPTKGTQCKCLSPSADRQEARIGPTLSRNRTLVS